MYFSAACLIGMRPLFSRLPTWIKDRILHESDVHGSNGSHKYGSSGGRTSSRLRIIHPHKDHYASITEAKSGTTTVDKSKESINDSKSLSQSMSSSPPPPPRKDIRIETRIDVNSLQMDLDGDSYHYHYYPPPPPPETV